MAHPVPDQPVTATRVSPRALRAALAAALVLGACVDLNVPPPGAVVLVRVSPDTVVLRIGDTASVRAAALDAGSALQAQRPVEWTSTAPAVVTVSGTGLLTALTAGTAQATALVDGVQGHAVVLVTGQPSTMAASAGTGQTAAVNAAVPVPPAVLVTDAGGNPVSNVPVTFAVASGGGSVAAAGPVLTGLDGIASAGTWTLGPLPGPNTLTATAGGSGVAGSPVTFTATGTVGPPSASMSTIIASPQGILPSSGTSFSTITVTVRDANGSTIAGATVSLAATGTGNALTQPTAATDLQGRTSGALSSSVAETKTITAMVNGTVTLTQTATVDVSASAPANLGVSTQPAGAVSNTVFTTAPTVDILDGFGNRVLSATDPVTVSLVSGNGTLVSASGSFTVNASSGRATFTGLRIRGTRTSGDTLGTGPHVLQFTAPGYNAVRSDTVQVGVSYAYNVVDVYTRNGCIGCHGFTYANSVNQPATLGACAGAMRIVPGDTVSSVIYAKIRTATPACGVVMPTSGLMSATQIRLIRDWILQGAPNN